MRRVRSENTQPELLLRRRLTDFGIRYRLHRRDLPGRPDVYIGRLRLAVFVHGCFWHGHACKRGNPPRSNAAFWNSKIKENKMRDERTKDALAASSIEVLELWTCETNTFEMVCRTIEARYRAAQ
jgi:DNA mismatch endonuclease (patch repair protein)